MAGQSDDYTDNSNNFGRDLIIDFGDEKVKDEFGFGRFYASGAAILHLLEGLGVDDARRPESSMVSQNRCPSPPWCSTVLAAYANACCSASSTDACARRWPTKHPKKASPAPVGSTGAATGGGRC